MTEAKKISKWSKQLDQLEGYVDPKYDAYAPENCMYTPSPSVNFIFNNKSHGIPKGSAVLLYGDQKSGKTFFINSMLEKMCKDDPEAMALFYNTEMRTSYQSGLFKGIDRDRVKYYDTNRPEEIFDKIEQDILPMLQEGMPIKYIVIDSLSSMAGTKSMKDGQSVNDHLMGDEALTLKKGLKKLLPITRRRGIILISTVHMVANFDAGSHGPKTKANTTSATRHGYDYFVAIKRANAAEDKQDLAGQKYEDESIRDSRGNKDATGHKIQVKMDQSSFGGAGRVGLITLSYEHGIINIEEEIFELCKGCGIIENLGAGGYMLYGEKVRGKAEVAKRIKESPELQAKLLADLKALDFEAV